ncbi:hypothetical protein BASA81_005803 [Batrachochytrium salamandrivorans]|nr:hypothetical protein BASA81_005803 [Batrachochytrium salamandrivorans]
MSQEEEEATRPQPVLKTGGARNEVRGVDGRVQEMRVKFDTGAVGSNPMDAERRRLEAQTAKAHAARYNMVLRGQQIMQAKKKRESLNVNSVLFQPHEFSEEWEDYPWHLAAAFTDEDDAFWMPELAMALETQDEMEINRAVLRFFLEEMDPDRVDQLDDLLVQFEGKEELLFLDLHNTYGAPPAAEEEEAAPLPKATGTRRASFVVSGVKKEDGSGWEMNNANEELVDKMKESGEDSAVLAAVVKHAEAGADPFEEKSEL